MLRAWRRRGSRNQAPSSSGSALRRSSHCTVTRRTRGLCRSASTSAILSASLSQANGEYPMTVRSLHLASAALVSTVLLFSGAPSTRAADPEPVQDTAAVELPSFRPGLWEYRRTLMRSGGPQVSTTRKCTNPGGEMREEIAELQQKNCQVAPLKRSRQHYISSWVCQTPSGAMRFRDVLTATDDSSYQDVGE